jgi:hypothetical protein
MDGGDAVDAARTALLRSRKGSEEALPQPA